MPLRVRRLRHAVRRPCRDRPPPRGGRPRRRPLLRTLARQAARIHLDPHARRPLRRLLDADRSARSTTASRAFPSVDRALRGDAARRLPEARRLPGRARRCCASSRRAASSTAILSNGSPAMLDAAVEAAGHRRPISTPCFRSTRSGCSSRGPRSMRWSPQAFALQARRGGVRVVEPLGRDGRRRVRLPHRLGQPRQDAGRIRRLPAGGGGVRPDRTAVGRALTRYFGRSPLQDAGRDCHSSHQKPHLRAAAERPARARQGLPGWSAA